MSQAKKTITILGVTGSVGQSTVDIILSAPESFNVYAITAHKNVELLAKNAIALNAECAVIGDESLLDELSDALNGTDIKALAGQYAIEQCAAHKVDIVMAAIMGFAGLKPILKALEQGTNVAIANKEPLVAAGDLIMSTAAQTGAKILPVDSEHNAIFQVFENHNRAGIDKIIITASGGPFLDWSDADKERATPEQAVKHPNWSMGKKISVDSASMMNKALEVIEAHYLFDLPPEKIDVLIHPQSVIHSMVSYIDGSILSQMGASDMRTPIAYALGWPDRIATSGDTLDLQAMSELTFKPAHFDQHLALKYAYQALEKGQAACIALNAANEVAVDLFLNHKIGFMDILKCVAHSVETLAPKAANKDLKTVEEIVELDDTIRAQTLEFIKTLA